MVCKALQMLVTWPLLTSFFFVFLSCANTTQSESPEIQTELSTITPAIVTLRPTATSQTSVAIQIPKSTVSSASVMTTRTLKMSTNRPPVSIATGSTKSTTQTHTATTFDTGSFIGGMVLALSLTLVMFFGYKFFCFREEIRYRTIEEHDAVI